MPAGARLRDAVLEAVLAAALAGVAEGAWIAYGAGAMALPAVAAAATLGMLPGALAARAVVAGLARVPSIARWRDAVRAGGTPRTQAAWRALAVTGFALALGAVAVRGFALVHDRYRFKDADAVGLVYVVGLGVAALALALTAGALDRLVRPALPAGLLDGPRGRAAAAVAGLAVATVPALVVGRAAPALSLPWVSLSSLLVLGVLAARAARPGRARRAWLVGAVALVAALAGSAALAVAPRARAAIAERGVASDLLARMLRDLADRDGDRFAGPRAGGADCDDDDPSRHPRAIEVPGNGVDENCTGADALGVTQGLRTQPRPVAPVPTRPNIVLVSVDALRADHLGSYGYARPTSPALDRLAASGVRFARAYTSCPSTRCAIPALLTGRYASTLTGPDPRAEIPGLAQVLRDAGYVTAAITCCARFELARNELSGFATLDASADTVRLQRAGQSNADVVIDRALAWLAAAGRTRPYFLWLHLYEPHFPYEAPAGPSFGNDAVDRYDREIAYLDRELSRLWAALDPATIVVVTADHGEEFGEHGVRFHARSLHEQVVRVPLLVRAPGTAPRVVDTPVSIVDVMPTLLDLAGVSGPAGMNGRSLVPALRGRPAPARPVYIELLRDHQVRRDMAAVVDGPWKVVWDRDANAWSLFRGDDPHDAVDRADDPALPALQRLLLETIDRETSALAR